MKTALITKTWLLFVFALTLLVACDGGQKPQPQAAPSAAVPKTPLVEKKQVADWCPEHGVPESICTRCNASLIDSFKKKGDWCARHELPNSQCVTCQPELKAKLEAMAPKDKR